MSTTRVMSGIVSQEGKTLNGLFVGPIVSRTPLRYRVTCQVCSSQTTESHQRITSGAARCTSSTHDRPTKRRDHLDDERRRATERENARLAEDQEASARRMESETQDYERPERYAPAPREMSQRERISLREFREAEEAAERERQRPIIEAERRAEREQAQREYADKERREKQTAYWRDWVLNDRDPQLYVSPDLATASMSNSKARAFNAEEGQKFIAETPEYADYKAPENADSITGYLSRNGVHISDAATFRAAFVRLRDLGILKKKPEPVQSSVEIRNLKLTT